MTSALVETPTVASARIRGGYSRRFRIACAISLIYVAVGTVGPFIIPFDASSTNIGDRLLAPGSTLSDGSTTWLGTDAVGRDLLPQLLIGARISILVGVGVLLFAGSVGVVIGVIAGFRGGWLDAILMRLADIQLAFPGILLAILIASLLGPSVFNVIVVLSLATWVTFARVARAQTLTVKEREYVDATRVLGARPLFLIVRCILPACLAPLLVVATVELGMVIITEAGLSFLGLGTPAANPSWGMTIASGRDYLASAWWISTIPGIALAILVLACGIMGDELRDKNDPRMENR